MVLLLIKVPLELLVLRDKLVLDSKVQMVLRDLMDLQPIRVLKVLLDLQVV